MRTNPTNLSSETAPPELFRRMARLLLRCFGATLRTNICIESWIFCFTTYRYMWIQTSPITFWRISTLQNFCFALKIKYLSCFLTKQWVVENFCTVVLPYFCGRALWGKLAYRLLCIRNLHLNSGGFYYSNTKWREDVMHRSTSISLRALT